MNEAVREFSRAASRMKVRRRCQLARGASGQKKQVAHGGLSSARNRVQIHAPFWLDFCRGCGLFIGHYRLKPLDDSCFTVVILVYLLGGFHPHTQTIRHSLRFLAPLARKTANIAGAGLVVDIADAVKEGLDSTKSSQAPQEAPDVTRSISKLRTELEELVDTIVTAGEGEKPLAKRLFVFIDDLDRLEPARAVEVMEALKVFLNIKGCVFVLAIDFSVVASGVKTKYGNDFEESKARAFFDKIIQIPFNLPVGSYSIEGLLGEGLKAIGIEIDKEGPEFEGFRNLVLFSVGTNPRSIKRLINTFGLLTTIQGVESAKGKSVVDNGNAQPSPLDLFAALAFQTAFPQIFENLMREMIFDKDPVDFFDEVIEQLTGIRAGEIESDQLEEWGLDRSRVGAATKFFKEVMNHFFVPGDKKKGAEDDREQAAQRIAAALGVAAVTAVGAGDIADSALRRSGASVLVDLDTRLRGIPAEYKQAKNLLKAFDDEINREFGGDAISAGKTRAYWSYESLKPELMIDRVQSRRFCEVSYARSRMHVAFGNYLEPDVFEKCQQEAESLGLNISHSPKSSPPLKIKDIATEGGAKKAASFIAKLYRRPQE
ncbi:KAP family P-loop NTPase fold protein [Actinotignum timonense]|uniref:KAP family P-loop NTPase fold protein n=4 Tax=Actinomycetaceae TaxID=2049 RepID=UPI0039756755